MYCQQFFSTEEEAKSFRKQHGFGVIMCDFAGKRQHRDYRVEAAMAGLSYAEIAEKPWCVAWNEDRGVSRG